MRKLKDLVSVGKATLEDFHLLGITTVEELAEHDAQDLYDRLCDKSGTRQAPCVRDNFEAAIAQAKDPDLPPEMCQWWYWSRRRKERREFS